MQTTTIADTTANHASGAALDFTEFKLGWRALLVAVAGVSTSVNATLLYGFSAMLGPLEQAFGWTRAELQPAITFLFLGAIVSSQVVGWLNQRYGLRRVTLLSLAALTCGFLLLTQLRGSVWSLYLGFMAIAWAGLGTLQVTWTNLVNLWYERNRGLALAITLSGTGIAAIAMPPLVTYVAQAWGWQGGFVVMALTSSLIAMPLVALWMRAPHAAAAAAAAAADGAGSGALPAPPALTGLSFRAGLRSAKFWRCNIGLTLVVSAILGIVTNGVPILRERGMSAMEAGQIFSSFGISLILGRVVVGYLVDRLWAPGVAAVALLLPAVGCVLFGLAGGSVPLLVLATLLVGIGAGAEFDLAAFLVARFFGLREYGRLFGVHLGLITLGSSLSPLLFGAMYKMTGSYVALLAYCTICFTVGALLLLTLGRYPVFTHED
ncbi:MFS transporter [Duganella sp. FT92W]|uniref:MFS transporter n=1 Tax=Pseudoduganella rivuli TaxID=2666085 RepID=A0A7X2IIA0_9BURK|nr:MFS transporter [Pseudoduganella rivuli]MRV70534.1 MFS transporter [Pseudoduganella rivuli]